MRPAGKKIAATRRRLQSLERETGLEPATLSLGTAPDDEEDRETPE
jgi:hypothetical protein